jgi:hypothetical protein
MWWWRISMHLQWSLIKNLLPSCCSSLVMKQDFNFSLPSRVFAISVHFLYTLYLKGCWEDPTTTITVACREDQV